MRAAAFAAGETLYAYIGHEYRGKKPRSGYTIPVPMFNIINGGKHAFESTDFQECMVVPAGVDTDGAARRAGAQVDRPHRVQVVAQRPRPRAAARARAARCDAARGSSRGVRPAASGGCHTLATAPVVSSSNPRHRIYRDVVRSSKSAFFDVAVAVSGDSYSPFPCVRPQLPKTREDRADGPSSLKRWVLANRIARARRMSSRSPPTASRSI